MLWVRFTGTVGLWLDLNSGFNIMVRARLRFSVIQGVGDNEGEGVGVQVRLGFGLGV